MFYCDPENGKWTGTDDTKLKGEKVVALVPFKKKLAVFTKNRCLIIHAPLSDAPVARAVSPVVEKSLKSRVSLVSFLLKLHDGSMLGVAGRIAVDLVAVVTVFLCFSAIVMWLKPMGRKKSVLRKQSSALFRFCYKNHFSIGIWIFPLILVVALTGIFLKPPFVKKIAGLQVHDLFTHKKQFKREIKGAVFLPEKAFFLISVRGGFLYGPSDFSKPYKAVSANIPISGMGTTVFKNLKDKKILVGSFKGLFKWDTGSVEGVNPSTGKHKIESVKNKAMISGAVVKNKQFLFYVDHRSGIKKENNNEFEIYNSDRISRESRISMWNFLFELHNGRLFRFLFGSYTWLLIPLSGILLSVTVLSGAYDWYYRKKGVCHSKN